MALFLAGFHGGFPSFGRIRDKTLNRDVIHELMRFKKN
jgi:hypothetical protein